MTTTTTLVPELAVVERAMALQHYLYQASSDGRGPEVFPCATEEQAVRLHSDMLSLSQLTTSPHFIAVRHELCVVAWLTGYGWGRMRAKYGPRGNTFASAG